jgi:hypothetical protein
VPSTPPSETGAERPADLAYRERLTPTTAWWATALVIGASLGLIALPLAGYLGLLLGALVGMALVTTLLLVTAGVVEVGGGRLRAGRASIDLDSVGAVQVLSRERMAALRGREIDPRAYLCQRSWLDVGVTVEVVDPADPTPYWLVSSRQPEALAAALSAHRVA